MALRPSASVSLLPIFYCVLFARGRIKAVMSMKQRLNQGILHEQALDIFRRCGPIFRHFITVHTLQKGQPPGPGDLAR